LKRYDKISENIEKCIRCGLCLSACPVYSIDREETSAPRGRLHIIDKIKDKKDWNRFINNCLLCGSCIDVCPNGVNIPELIREFRKEEEVYRSIYPVLRTVQGNDFKKMGFLSALLNIDRDLGGLLRLFYRDRRLPDRSGEKIEYNNELKDGSIAIFTGCISKLFYSGIINKLIRFYRSKGYNVYIPEGQGCCGLMNYSAGDYRKVISLVQRNMALFNSDKIEKILTPCASCEYMLLKYRDLVDNGSEISRKVVSLDDALIDLIHNSIQKLDRMIAVHIPCHIRNKTNKGVYLKMKGLAKSNKVEIVDLCCGYGGVFNAYEYERSLKIGRIALSRIRSNEIYTLCSGCYLQFYDIVSRLASYKKVYNLIDILSP